jgi:hypothetical protein
MKYTNSVFIPEDSQNRIQCTKKKQKLQKKQGSKKVIVSQYVKRYVVYKARRKYLNIVKTGGRLRNKMNKNIVVRSRHKGCELRITWR